MIDEDDADVADVAPKTNVQKNLELILRQHALSVWGELRGIDQLDSATAVKLIVEEMQELLAHVPSAQRQADVQAYQNLMIAARKIRQALMATWGEDVTAEGKTYAHTVRLCRVCKGKKNAHEVECPVGIAIKQISKLGI